VIKDDESRRQFDAVLSAACRQIGVPASGADLLHLHSNAVFALRSADLVVRISSGLAVLDRITASLKVTAWLAARGLPCTAPAPVVGQPFTIAGPAQPFARRELALRVSTLQAGEHSARWNRTSPARPREA